VTKKNSNSVAENMTKKTWVIREGLFAYETDHGLLSPSADEIYSAAFEKKYSNGITAEDIIELASKLTFSHFPVNLKIIRESDGEGSIRSNVYAISPDGVRGTVQLDADHIIIENTWYPFVPGAIDEILQTLKLANMGANGKISLGQYLSLLKSASEYISNEVISQNIKVPQKYITEKPKGITADLYPYQMKGWQWLRFLSDEKIGGILADEMGLGKTLQVIALIGSMPHKRDSPSLIISPTTLLENWRREFGKFAPEITTHVHQGRKIPIEINTDDHALTEQIVNLWVERFYGCIISLLPLEDKELNYDVTGLPEGALTKVLVNRYERSRYNRNICINFHGYACKVCGTNLAEYYGKIAEGFIHVHHSVPVSQLGPNYMINPIIDLVPVCPNCHAMLHKRNPPYSIQELQDKIRNIRRD
jgi:SNF2-related domain/HNH endonuclease